MPYYLDENGVWCEVGRQTAPMAQTEPVAKPVPNPFGHPTHSEPEFILGTYVVRDCNTKEYVHMSDAQSYDRLYEFDDPKVIEEELMNYGIEAEDLEFGWDPVPGFEDQYESVFFEA